MTVQLAPAPVFQGPPFGQLFSYQAGTSTPQATYPDSTQTTPNTNPVVLNALGQAFVWLDTAKTYKLILQDSLGNQIWSEDNISGGAFVSSTNGFGTDSGIVNAYIFTHAIASAPASLIAGSQIRFTPLNTNTGPSTLNADGSGAVAIIRANGSALTGGELSSLGPVVLQSTGTQWQIVSTAGAQPGYERTVAETTAGIIPTSYAFPSSPSYDVRRYGAALNAAWNGTSATGTDDSTAFINAIKVASAAGGGEVTFNGPSIIKNVPLLSYVTVRGIGNSVLYLNPVSASDVHFNALGVAGAAVAVTNNIAVGGQTLNVANTSTFSVGQYVVVQTTGTAVPTDYVFYGGAPLYPTSNGRKQQIARVESIVLNTSITLDEGMAEPYTGGSCQVAVLNPVTWNNATGAVIGFRVYDCICRVAIGNNGGGMQIWYGIDFIVQRNTLIGASGYPAIRSIQSAYGDIGFNRIADCQQVGAGLSTGIAHDIIESSHYIEVHDNKISYLTEDEVGMRVHHCQYHHNHYIDAFDSGINTHGNSNFHIDIHDNVIDCPNASSGIAIGYSANRTVDSNITVARNRIVNSGGKGISVVTQQYTVTGATQANPIVVTINTVSGTNPINVNDVLSHSGFTTMTQMNGQRATVTAIGGVSGAWTYTLGSINSTAYTAFGAGTGSTARAPQNVKIINNAIIGWKVTSGGTSPGIQGIACDDLEVSGNTLDGATIGNAVDAGISLVNCVRPRVAFNLAKNCTAGYGLQLVNCYGWTGAYNQLNNNQNQCNTSGSGGPCLLSFNISDTTTNSIEATGIIRIGNTVDGSPLPITGWGTPTGGVVTNNFPGATATLLQTSEAVAEIITQLKASGLFGA